MSTIPPNGGSCVAALAPSYARLQAALETSARRVEDRAGAAGAAVAELQRRAIVSLQECADVTLRLAESLGDSPCPRSATCLRLGDWNRCDACFDAQAGRFLDQAGRFTTAIAACAGPESGAVTRAAQDKVGSGDALHERMASFTEAQQRVFELLMTGLPNKLIAYEIGVSEATIKAHVSAVLRKLRVRSRAQAIALSTAFARARHEPSPPVLAPSD